MAGNRGPYRVTRKSRLKDRPTRELQCLCCERKTMTLRLNPATGIFEGFRTCRDCRRDRHKTRFYSGMNGD